MFAEIFERRKGGPGSGNGAIIELTGIRKVYDMGTVQVEALRGVDLALRPGEFVSVVGPSGSGKSTLMNIVGCLDTPSGRLVPAQGRGGRQLLARPPRRGPQPADRLRLPELQLLPQLTAYENVELPLLFAGMATRQRRERTERMLAMSASPTG